MGKSAVALRHVHFEDLGSFAAPLEENGYAVRYDDVGDADFLAFDPREPDLLIVLGGPVGVYDGAAYPFLDRERAFIAGRLAEGRPTLGICLGAQLIAAALGAKVVPSGVKEIGFSPLSLTDEGKRGPLRHLDGCAVLHWHGDTYALPEGATHLASTAAVAQQAFSLGSDVLGLQFHPEVDVGAGFERWLVGHAHELAAAGIDVAALRVDAGRHGRTLAGASARMIREWLAGLGQRR
ncbi:glutamine amidotransferase [Azospirillum sp. ST 5-10]|uniref:glutamine amidotransferase n=1 Tax=unclassified Azospirillum TaxID=2630922 RepID=UPI003F49C166